MTFTGSAMGLVSIHCLTPPCQEQLLPPVE